MLPYFVLLFGYLTIGSHYRMIFLKGILNKKWLSWDRENNIFPKVTKMGLKRNKFLFFFHHFFTRTVFFKNLRLINQNFTNIRRTVTLGRESVKNVFILLIFYVRNVNNGERNLKLWSHRTIINSNTTRDIL